MRVTRLRNQLEYVFGVVGLLFVSEAVLPLWRQAAVPEGPGSDPVVDALLLCVVAGLGIFGALRWKSMLRVLVREKSLSALLALACASAWWSIAPEFTSHRAVGLVILTLFAMYLGVRYRGPELLNLVAVSLGLGILMSVLVALLAPKLGISQDDHIGAWRGVYAQKNILARVCLLETLITAFLLRGRGRQNSWIRWTSGAAAVVGSAAVMILAKSATCDGLLLLMVGGAGALGVVRAHWKLRWVILVALSGIAMGAGWFAVEHADLATGVLGRDTSLSGRTVVWAAIAGRILARPFVGYGFGSFWSVPNAGLREIWKATGGWQAAQSHNGYLDIALDLGFGGMALVAFCLGQAVIRSWRLIRKEKGVVSALPLLFCLLYLAYNLTESAFMKETNILWSMFVALLVGLGHWRDGWGAQRPAVGEHQ